MCVEVGMGGVSLLMFGFWWYTIVYWEIFAGANLSPPEEIFVVLIFAPSLC